ncbi:hypothetical protein DTO271D3_4023 [Paecilomyces variotii]|nr:hypothetical protein DTO271D3_4023 [Paecilomyces variotii]
MNRHLTGINPFLTWFANKIVVASDQIALSHQWLFASSRNWETPAIFVSINNNSISRHVQFQGRLALTIPHAMSSTDHNTFLELLPTEILYDIRDLLQIQDIKHLSCVSKKLRQICLPLLFHEVKFRFSKPGFDELRSFIESEVRHYTVSFTYVAPQLLRPEILDFEYWTSNLFTFQTHRYVEEAKELYDLKYHDGECPSYMVIYDRLQKICEEQRGIINTDTDIAVLSSALQKLPKLAELRVDFCRPVQKGDWLQSYLDLDMTMGEKSYEHHLKVVSKAIWIANGSGVPLRTVCLSQLQLPYHDGRKEEQYPGRFLETLRVLLDRIENLRLDRCNFLLGFSRAGLDLRRIDMNCPTDENVSLSYGGRQVNVNLIQGKTLD